MSTFVPTRECDAALEHCVVLDATVSGPFQKDRGLGHSKEGTWTPQVVVALAVTREGIPVRSWVFPGCRHSVQF